MSATIPDFHTENQDYIGDADPSDIIHKLFEIYL
jgi:hypothetical protein